MATIKVNSTVMRDKANGFKTVSKSVRALTDDMKNEINSLRAYWEGEAAEAYVSKFISLSGKFDEIFNTVNQYADFLNQAANEYDATENQIKSAVQ